MTLVLAIAAWCAAAYKLPRARATAADWALPATLATLALGLTLKVPAVYEQVGRAAGAPHLGQLIKDVSIVLSAFGTQVVLLYLLHPAQEAGRHVRRRGSALLLILAVMAISFAVADTAATFDQLRSRLASRGLLEFRGAYLLFLTWAFVDIARLCWRFAALAGERSLTTGLRLIAAGGAAGLGYAASGALQLVAAGERDVSLVQGAQRVSDALIGLATLLVVTGSTLPALLARFGQAEPSTRWPGESGTRGWAGDGLERLWWSLTRALPDVVLPSNELGGPAGKERVYRQIIEIEDSRRALRALRGRAVEDAAARAVLALGIPDVERSAAVEGVALALAVHLLDHGASSDQGGEAEVGSAITSPAAEPAMTTGTALESEAAWLSKVGDWYADGALVTMAKRHLAWTSEVEDAHDRTC